MEQKLMTNIPKPFGLHFLVENPVTPRIDELKLHYLEDGGYTVIAGCASSVPWVKGQASLSIIQTVTLTREQPEDGDDRFASQGTHVANTFLTTVTTTRAEEGPDENDPENINW